MGSLSLSWLSLSFFFLHFSLLIAFSSSAEVNGGGDTPPAAIPLLAPPPESPVKSKGSPFRPSIAVIVGVLTTVFSVTFLLLLYAKHCRRADYGSPFSARSYPPAASRRNSGIDRAVIESLPIFRFASLRGQKDGLECAVCLNRFESTEVLRLLPKCKHAFHVECVDTWLDAHSTCPLCRYRVDPEDILLVGDNRILYPSGAGGDTPARSSYSHPTPEQGVVSRVSGRHSFAGNPLEVIVEAPRADVGSFVPRRSLDSWKSRKKRNSEIVGVGCFDRHARKEELLLAAAADEKGKAVVVGGEQRRVEHRIIISGETDIEAGAEGVGTGGTGPNHRWSDVEPLDLLFLRSEMILSDSSRRFSSSRTSTRIAGGGGEASSSNSRSSGDIGGSGREVINGRSVSEITGLSRFRGNESSSSRMENDEDHQQQPQQQQRPHIHIHNNHQNSRSSSSSSKKRRKGGERHEEQRKRQEGAVSRWLAWISQSPHSHKYHQHRPPPQPQPALHATTTTTTSSSPPPPPPPVV